MDTAVKAQDYYTALEIFLKTRKLFNGEWKVASNGRWNLFEGNGPTYPPGTTGFAYDIWPFYWSLIDAFPYWIRIRIIKNSTNLYQGEWRI